jgi:hypothetical protein
MTRFARAAFVVLLATIVWGQIASAQNAASSKTTHQKAPFKTMEQFVAWIQAHHKAPFDRDSARLPQGAAAEIMKMAGRPHPEASPLTAAHNVRVNKDRDPWPKAEVAVGVDPVNGNVVVMTNDFRENYDHMFYHVSTNGGSAWTDDSMVGGNDPFSGFVPLNFQSDPGVAFDDKGHSYISTITGNLIFDFNNLYENADTQIIVAQGFNHGTYTNLIPIVIDTVPCNGNFDADGVFVCPGTLDKPLITVDSVPGSPNNGTVYVYYTYFCTGTPNPDGSFGPCIDGNATIPSFSSAILESHAPVGGPFSLPNLVSGTLTQEQFSDIVIDSHGVPHAFFDDYTSFPFNMYESTLSGGVWTVNPTPVATFQTSQTGTSNWGFRLNGTEAPGCGISGDIAHCVFSANQVGAGPFETSLSVYDAVVNTQTGASTTTRVNNDVFNGSKDHIFPWATAKADGSVYVGFYDDRDDPFLTKVKYWVAKSTDGGATFPTQMAVSDTSFNPCVGFPGCGFFGDYTQIAAGPDGVVHAAWSDTRDGASMQIFGQAITW